MLPEKTKVLTPRGFINVEDVIVGDKIYSLDKSKQVLTQSTVLKNEQNKTECFSLSNKRFQLTFGSGLKFTGWRRSKTKGKPSVKVDVEFEVSKTTQEHNAIIAYPVEDGTYNVGEDKSELLGYIASDGYWVWSKKKDVTSSSNGKRKQICCSLTQAEHKFLEDIKQLLDRLGAKYSVFEKKSDNLHSVYGFTLSSPWAREFMQSVFNERKDKHEVNWAEFVLSLDKPSFDGFFRGFYNGDGTLGTTQIAQNPGNTQDGVVASMLRLGMGVVSKNRRSDGTICEVVRYHTRRHITMQEVLLEPVGKQECYDIQTELGSCVIMQHKFIGTVLTR